MKQGYHYTTYKNWLKIKRTGLMPSLITNENICETLKFYGIREKVYGIWIWKKRHFGRTHLGDIVRVMAMHDSTHVVYLKVKYRQEVALRVSDREVEATHDGAIGNFKYHKEEKAVIVIPPIPADQIELIGDYDLLTISKQDKI